MMQQIRRFGPKIPFLVVLATGGFACPAAMAETGPVTTSCDARRCCICPDDYCPKPLPCVPCAPLGRCDCYAPKPLPCPPCALRYCAPDDYCPKPCCVYLPACYPAWYICGASKNGPMPK